MHLLVLSCLDTLLKIALEVVRGVPLENREKFWDRYDARIERWEKLLDGPDTQPKETP
jgi:hypothetical protein